VLDPGFSLKYGLFKARKNIFRKLKIFLEDKTHSTFMLDTLEREARRGGWRSGRTESGEEAQAAPFSFLASFPPKPTLRVSRHAFITQQQSPCYHLAA
jgi:hypothetical protein